MTQALYNYMPTSFPATDYSAGQVYSNYGGSNINIPSMAKAAARDNSLMETLTQDFSNLNFGRYVTPNGHPNSNMIMAQKTEEMIADRGPAHLFYPPQGPVFGINGQYAPARIRPFRGQPDWNGGLLAQYSHDQYQQSFRGQGIPGNLHNQQWVQQCPPVPDLIEPRRTSMSSRDEASPQTPTYNGAAFVPMDGTTPSKQATPSPMSSSQAFYPHFWKTPEGKACVIDYWELMNRDPAVPEAIPAPRSGPDGGRGTLAKILDNPDSVTNVYVRGLHPQTTDEMLLAYGIRFGSVMSCKAIVELKTSECKGFGFIKYHNYVDAENCIRGFYHKGYEAKFARKSHNSRLKDLASPDNTNLYVSNLPQMMTETGLKDLFETKFPKETHPNHQAESCKILKDSYGISRGVGFARFESPTICNEVLEAFNNQDIGIGEDATTLSIRFADTEDQKKLKQLTAIKRQFKADEYNEVVHGIPFQQYPEASVYHTPISSRLRDLSSSCANRLSHSPESVAGPLYPKSVLRTRQPLATLTNLPNLRTNSIDNSKLQDSETAHGQTFSQPQTEPQNQNIRNPSQST